LEPLTVFVGPNGAGKSSLLDALRFVRDAMTGRLEEAISRRGGMSALRRWSPKGRPFDVTIELHITGENWQAEYGFVLGGEHRGEFRIKTEFCEMDYQGKKRFYRIVNGQGETGRRHGDEAYWQTIRMSTEELFLPHAASLGDPAFATLWGFLRNMGFYSFYPNTLRVMAPPTNPHPLKDNGENITSTLRTLQREYPQAYDRIRRHFQAAVTDADDIGIVQVGGYLIAQVLRKREGGRAAFDLGQESDGTLRLLALFTALFQEPPLAVVGIEEPELNIYPEELTVLKGAFDLVSRQTQVLVVTHSPDLLDGLPPESFRVVEMRNGVTQAGPIASYQQEAIREHLFTPSELFRIEELRRKDAS